MSNTQSIQWNLFNLIEVILVSMWACHYFRLKQLSVVNDDKKKELDALLVRAQTAIWGLLIVFENAAVPYFKNLEQVFHDILAIFKRCKEFDKILKSSFFDDDEIDKLISSIKDELKKEKTGKLSRHVANIYKNRTLANENPISDTTECVEAIAESPEKLQVNDVKGAEGGAAAVMKENAEISEQKKALIDKMTNTDDPLLQIILDSLIAQEKMLDTFESGTKKSENSSIPCAKGEYFKSMDNLKQQTIKDYMQSVVKSVSDNGDQEFSTVLQSAKSETGPDSSSEPCIDKESSSCDIKPNVREDKPKLDGETRKPEDSKKVEEMSKEKIMHPNHKTLCIQACKALNVRVMQIKQEVVRKWLAHKFGCDDSVSAIQLFEKMQEKMSESVESENGPLKLIPDGSDTPKELKNEVIQINGENIHGAECIKELESLVEGRASFESESMTDELDSSLNGIGEEKGKSVTDLNLKVFWFVNYISTNLQAIEIYMYELGMEDNFHCYCIFFSNHLMSVLIWFGKHIS